MEKLTAIGIQQSLHERINDDITILVETLKAGIKLKDDKLVLHHEKKWRMVIKQMTKDLLGL